MRRRERRKGRRNVHRAEKSSAKTLAHPPEFLGSSREVTQKIRSKKGPRRGSLGAFCGQGKVYT